jgi:broad specificity phosphatase PhoE
MQITLIRHLPTEWNKNHILQGRRDIEICPLSTEDRKNINNNLKLLKELSPFAFILASSLKRTHQTALQYGFLSETESLLDELDFGPFEGHSKEELIATYKNTWMESPRKLVLGESLKNLENRILLFLDKYERASNILVFGHGSWIRALVSFCHDGHINNMNKIEIQNNQLITLSLYK